MLDVSASYGKLSDNRQQTTDHNRQQSTDNRQNSKITDRQTFGSRMFFLEVAKILETYGYLKSNPKLYSTSKNQRTNHNRELSVTCSYI